VKIHIIGLAGSGKTTLARWIGDAFDVPGHDLDFVVYDATGERPLAEINASIDAIRALPGWVTEGAYQDAWLRPLLDDAEHVAWLDVPVRVCITRITKRHLAAELARNNPHPGWRRLARFLDYTRRTANSQRAETLALLSSYGDKVTHCRSHHDVTEFKRRVDSGDRKLET
jgi:shikimate kinase